MDAARAQEQLVAKRRVGLIDVDVEVGLAGDGTGDDVPERMHLGVLCADDPGAQRRRHDRRRIGRSPEGPRARDQVPAFHRQLRAAASTAGRDTTGVARCRCARPWQHHTHLKSTTLLERLNEEIQRRMRVVRIFPNPASCLRFQGAVCRDPRGLVRRPPLPVHGLPHGTAEGPAAGGSMNEHDHGLSHDAQLDVHKPVFWLWASWTPSTLTGRCPRKRVHSNSAFGSAVWGTGTGLGGYEGHACPGPADHESLQRGSRFTEGARRLTPVWSPTTCGFAPGTVTTSCSSSILHM